MDNVSEEAMEEKFMALNIGEIHAVMCFAYTNQIPKNVDELDKFSHDAFLQSAKETKMLERFYCIYCVVKEKGGGKLIVKF